MSATAGADPQAHRPSHGHHDDPGTGPGRGRGHPRPPSDDTSDDGSTTTTTTAITSSEMAAPTAFHLPAETDGDILSFDGGGSGRPRCPQGGGRPPLDDLGSDDDLVAQQMWSVTDMFL